MSRLLIVIMLLFVHTTCFGEICEYPEAFQIELGKTYEVKNLEEDEEKYCYFNVSIPENTRYTKLKSHLTIKINFLTVPQKPQSAGFSLRRKMGGYLFHDIPLNQWDFDTVMGCQMTGLCDPPTIYSTWINGPMTITREIYADEFIGIGLLNKINNKTLSFKVTVENP